MNILARLEIVVNVSCIKKFDNEKNRKFIKKNMWTIQYCIKCRTAESTMKEKLI